MLTLTTPQHLQMLAKSPCSSSSSSSQCMQSDVLDFQCNQAFSTWYAAAAGVTFQVAKVEGVQHEDGGSHVLCSDGTRIRGCMVLDATGHARKLVEYDKPFDPGYQVPILTHPSGSWLRLACHLFPGSTEQELHRPP